MSVVFVNRVYELSALQAWWDRPAARPALVWGRRRVGKTALLEHFASTLGHRVVFHTGAGDIPGVELADFSRHVASVFPNDLRDPASSPYESWRDALDHLARLAADEPVLLVLDEFPELVAASPMLPGVMRAFLDRAMGRTKLRIILSGSAIRTVDAMREYRAPLYGRFDLTLLLNPFPPHDAAAMLPDLAPAERALVYGVTGGMPLYLAWWDQSASIVENLRRLACQPGAPLFTEGKLIMATEAGVGEQTAAVLSAIAAGRTRYQEIGDAVGKEPSRTLDRLIELRLVERVVPVTDDPARTKRRIYRICDEFLAFYLGPLARYRAEIERGLGDSIAHALADRLDDHMGAVYEEAFRSHLRYAANHNLLGDRIVAIGPWWTTDGQNQIDTVVLAEPTPTRVPVLAGEATWAKSVNGARIKAQLMRKALHLSTAPEDLRYAVCAREEITHTDPDLLTITAADIFTPGA